MVNIHLVIMCPQNEDLKRARLKSEECGVCGWFGQVKGVNFFFRNSRRGCLTIKNWFSVLPNFNLFTKCWSLFFNFNLFMIANSFNLCHHTQTSTYSQKCHHTQTSIYLRKCHRLFCFFYL